MDFIREYWWLLLIVVIAVAVAFMLLRPRQRVHLTDSAPVRPHMAQQNGPPEGRGIAGEAAAATEDVAAELLHVPVRGAAEPAQGSDDFSRMKGVGPKFADALNAAGFHRYEQLAQLTPTEIERLDAQLGAFGGRITRDRVVEQANYLARGDTDGFEQRFGKL